MLSKWFKNVLFYNPTIIKESVFRDLIQLRRHFITGFINHFREVSFWVAEQFVGVVKLHQAAGVHHHNAVRVHDGVQSVRHREHRALREPCSYCSLDKFISSVNKFNVQRYIFK